jgi:geranylgeranyl pyrophosphate synthase
MVPTANLLSFDQSAQNIKKKMMMPLDSDLDKVLEPYRYVCSVQGKQIRTQLIQCFNEWLHVDQQQVEVVKGIAESLHSSSLM